MTGLEIFLIIAGFACLCVSFFAAQRMAPDQTEESGVQASAVWTEKEEQMIRDRVNEILSERQNELVETTEEQMNRLCNDKIMAVDEFSKQLLEKIQSNHQEVVFMYNMLNEKQKDIKQIMAEPVKRKEEEPVPPEPSPQPETNIEQVKTEEAPKPKPEPKPAKKKIEKKAEPKPVEEIKTEEEMKPEEVRVPGNVNVQIQKMYKEGKSVLEISKALNIGQGEVKLVIALYGGKKG